ncbi:MAG: DUF455 family protein, partial [Verrucomicrobiota bacterium]
PQVILTFSILESFSVSALLMPGSSASSPIKTALPKRERISDVASRVLFSETLEEKLWVKPLRQIDFSGSRALTSSAPVIPGRPNELKFADRAKARPKFPKSAHLVDEQTRGVLLHFFANHELLAAELMALALLKFPDAPEAFRRGLAKTLQEEQLHTRWYLDRLDACGVEFGEFPVNRFFWDAVSTMETPVDYVARLSLTFEQANLDYSRHYAGILREAGDVKSAELLEKIYRDEISHVGYGLHWFRKWKEPDSDDWGALSDRLIFPLSPARAKATGAPFNEEGRRLAGFDMDYIKALELYKRSRGRTPDVWYFNPDAENRIAQQDRPYDPPAAVRSITEDLEILSGFLAKQDDLVLQRSVPSVSHIERLERVGLALPEIEELDSAGNLAPDSLTRSRKLHSLQPWSLSPELPAFWGCLADQCSGRQIAGHWSDDSAEIFSKACQIESLGTEGDEAIVWREDRDLIARLSEWEKAGYNSIVMKKALAVAGSGHLLTTTSELKARVKFSDRNPEADGDWVIEPWHKRVFDFSVQYEFYNNELKHFGVSRQLIDSRGQYKGTIVPTKICQDLSADLAAPLMREWLPHYMVGSEFTSRLAQFLASRDYSGPLGVDAYLYQNPRGQLCHRLFCEVNPRYTMGRVALSLARKVASGHHIQFSLHKASPKLLDEDPSPAVELDKEGKLCAGSIWLTDQKPDQRFAAKLSVAKKFRDL